VVLISKLVEEDGVATYIFGQAHSDFAQVPLNGQDYLYYGGDIITAMCINVG
jgi:hypothetical protein